MDVFDAAEMLRSYWLERAEALSSHQMMAASCPYCGKGDRIRVLPQPGDEADPSVTAGLRSAWDLLASGERLPALCGFCQNIVILRGNQAEMPAD
jgi:hypothetical protein